VTFIFSAVISQSLARLTWYGILSYTPSSVIRDPRYGNVSTCSNFLFWMSIWHAMPLLAITLVLLTLMSRLSQYFSLQFFWYQFLSLPFAFLFSLIAAKVSSDIHFFLFWLDVSNLFSGYFQQDCLYTFPEIFWGYLILCSLQCCKPVGHLCRKLYCFLFLEFLEIQRWYAVLSLSFSQPDVQHRHDQLMICVVVCFWIRATVHQACFPSLCNWDVVYRSICATLLYVFPF